MRGRKECLFSDIQELPMKDIAKMHGTLGSSLMRAIPGGPLISIFDYSNLNRRSRSDKGYCLRACEDIPPNTKIAYFVGEIVPSVDVSLEMQSIALCNNMSMVRPETENFKGKHIAWCANDARFERIKGRLMKNNSMISGFGQIRQGKMTAVSLISTQKIWANSEIFCNYGRTYNAIQKANFMRKSRINKAIDSLRVHDQREARKKRREKLGLVPLKRGRPRKGEKHKKIGS
jgi:hypothetical protein